MKRLYCVVLVETTPEDDSASGSSIGPQAEPQSSLVDPEGDETTASGIRPATPIDFYPVLTFEQLQKSNALWVLKISETRQLSRTAVSGIVQDTSDLISGIMCEVKRQVDHTLSANGVDPAILARVFHPENPCLTPFEGIHTFHQQLQYYRKNFNLVVGCILCLCSFIDDVFKSSIYKYIYNSGASSNYAQRISCENVRQKTETDCKKG